MRIEISRKWEGSHRLISGVNKGTLCSLPHGHTWKVTAFFEAIAPFNLDGHSNVLILFSDLKKRWHHWIDNHIDHSIFLNSTDPLISFLQKENPQSRIVVTPGDPTTEMIACLFKAKLESFILDENFQVLCRQIHIQETATNAVTYAGNPKETLSSIKFDGPKWWNQADYSVM